MLNLGGSPTSAWNGIDGACMGCGPCNQLNARWPRGPILRYLRAVTASAAYQRCSRIDEHAIPQSTTEKPRVEWLHQAFWPVLEQHDQRHVGDGRFACDGSGLHRCTSALCGQWAEDPVTEAVPSILVLRWWRISDW